MSSGPSDANDPDQPAQLTVHGYRHLLAHWVFGGVAFGRRRRRQWQRYGRDSRQPRAGKEFAQLLVQQAYPLLTVLGGVLSNATTQKHHCCATLIQHRAKYHHHMSASLHCAPATENQTRISKQWHQQATNIAQLGRTRMTDETLPWCHEKNKHFQRVTCIILLQISLRSKRS